MYQQLWGVGFVFCFVGFFYVFVGFFCFLVDLEPCTHLHSWFASGIKSLCLR